MITNRRFVHNASICRFKQESNTLSGVAFGSLWPDFPREGGDKLRLRTISIKKATPYRELLFCIPKTTRWASGSKEAAADEEK